VFGRGDGENREAMEGREGRVAKEQVLIVLALTGDIASILWGCGC